MGKEDKNDLIFIFAILIVVILTISITIILSIIYEFPIKMDILALLLMPVGVMTFLLTGVILMFKELGEEGIDINGL